MGAQKDTDRNFVLKYHCNAIAKNVGCKNGNYYHIITRDGINEPILGRGKSKRNAWRSAFKNL